MQQDAGSLTNTSGVKYDMRPGVYAPDSTTAKCGREKEERKRKKLWKQPTSQPDVGSLTSTLGAKYGTRPVYIGVLTTYDPFSPIGNVRILLILTSIVMVCA